VVFLSGRLIKEGRFVRLWELDAWWVIEDKTLLQYPVEFTGNTKTAVSIYMDFVRVEGRLVPVRTYYPKDQFPLDVVERVFYRLEQKRQKEFERLRRYLGAMETQEQQQEQHY